MNRFTKIITLIGICIVGFVVEYSLFMPELREKPQSSQKPQFTFEASYAEVSLSEMIAKAETIVVGKVTTISPAMWNQDSGKYWQKEGYPTLPFHEIAVVIDQTLVDNIGIDKNVVITVLGASPNGAVDESVEISQDVTHNLKVDNEAVFFLVKRELAWQDGTHPIIRFMGYPMMGYLKKAEDGLYHFEGEEKSNGMSINELKQQIAER